MKFKPKLNFCKIHEVSTNDGYGKCIKTPILQGNILNQYAQVDHVLKTYILHQNPKHFNYFINSKVASGFFNTNTKHIMFLDCDHGNIEETISHLKENGIQNFQLIESSAGHFWLICDIFNSFEKLLYIAETIPNVDYEYLETSNVSKSFCLRCYPKACLPKFIDFKNLKGSDEFINWTTQLKQYWDRPIMQWAVKNMFLKNL